MHNSFITIHAQFRITVIKHTLNYYFVGHQISVEDEYTPEVFNRRSEWFMILMFQLVYAPVNLPLRVEISSLKHNEATRSQ